ncbi:hypothetical protein BJV74DRAFT_821441, partial [Russula compacta]
MGGASRTATVSKVVRFLWWMALGCVSDNGKVSSMPAQRRPHHMSDVLPTSGGQNARHNCRESHHKSRVAREPTRQRVG